MKRLLVLLPLLLVGCTNGSSSLSRNRDNSHTNNEIYQNVSYVFNIDKHCYKVYHDEETFDVPPSNYYEIKLDSYKQTTDFRLLENEYFVSTNELFVYYVK